MGRVYRLRSIDMLLGNDEKGIESELDGEYFYFADKDQLNDPIEGYMDLYWKGDEIAWIGLFKNYVWQLYFAIMLIPVYRKNDRELFDRMKKLFLTRSERFRKEKLGEERREIEELFAHKPRVIELAKELGDSGAKINSEALNCILFMIHANALMCVWEYLDGTEYAEYFPWIDGILKRRTKPESESIPIKRLLDNSDTFKLTADFFSWLERQYSFLFAEKTSGEAYVSKIIEFIRIGFSKNYVEQIQNFAVSEGYNASFTKSIDDVALWGYYTDGHRGAALIFDYEEDEMVELYPKFVENPGEIPYTRFKKVHYGDAEKTNFFYTLGHLFGDEREHWLVNDGKKSRILEDMLRDENYGAWYNRKLTDRFLVKNKDWSIENEYRIVIDDEWSYHGDLEKRKYRYDFKRLRGIVFGLRMSYEDRLSALDIVKRKIILHKPKEFEIYEAVYDRKRKKIGLNRLKAIEDRVMQEL